MTGTDATSTQECTDSVKNGLRTYRGVYQPTVLTILGLMLYLREGWVLGEAGLLGAMLWGFSGVVLICPNSKVVVMGVRTMKPQMY